jgi:hypothetical protein
MLAALQTEIPDSARPKRARSAGRCIESALTERRLRSIHSAPVQSALTEKSGRIGLFATIWVTPAQGQTKTKMLELSARPVYLAVQFRTKFHP